MTNPETHHTYYPNKLGRIILLAMEEVIGRNGLNAVLNQANLSYLINNNPPNDAEMGVKFEEISRIQAVLEEIYGPRGGRGVALRAGRACFKYGLREFGPTMGFTDLAFRLLPLDEKLRSGAKILTDIFNQFPDQKMVIREEEDRYLWEIDLCPLCWQRQTDAPVCHLLIGLLQEALYWVSGGKFYNIEEVKCTAMGEPACVIVVDKQPVD